MRKEKYSVKKRAKLLEGEKASIEGKGEEEDSNPTQKI